MATTIITSPLPANAHPSMGRRLVNLSLKAAYWSLQAICAALLLPLMVTVGVMHVVAALASDTARV